MLQKSLIKAMQLIDVMAGEQNDYGVTEIASKLQINKSNAHDILSTFEHLGYVRRDPDSRRYSLDYKFLTIAQKIANRLSFQEVARKQVALISNEVQEICYFGVPYGDKILYLEGGFPSENFSTKPVLGMTAPLYCTGLGKAVLAHLPKEEQDAICNGPLKQITENTITTAKDLLDELERIKLRGYSIDNMEHEFGIKCVAVAVFDKNGKVRGGLSITGPSLRFPNKRIEELALLLKSAADTISGSF
ncbi:IclR family transcriptional regulator [Anaerobiospirillum sp. NML120448]|uniref:IclR family transcriptional regulator n=1 Tax=Anaerobiospirillum sp. NML120448 TaxID=2932816 RepID=UPI001FF5BEFA|nr:IclR family transcriptional regulator [Anaerobiospirillum sp. NML120448]MCK0515509.1 IclR family transcriptional regulator [Anaerobiospirillum sp. NML120448]